MLPFRPLPATAASLLLGLVLAMRAPAAAPAGAAVPPVATPAPAASHDLAPTLKAPLTATAAPDADGFITRWLLLEPIPGDGRVTDSAVQAAAHLEYFPDQYTVVPHDGDKVTVDGGDYAWHAVDTTKFNVNLYHFGYYLGKPTSNVVFWGVAVIDCPEEIPGVRLVIGSNAGSVWWVNGQEVTAIYGDRQTVIDDGVSKRLTLKKGPNIVRFIVVNNAGMVDCCARFLDADEKPLRRFQVSLAAPKN
jgi:hypothetical protein